MSKTFIFSWDITGIEAIIPVDKYEKFESENTWAVLNDEEPKRNPLTGIVQNLILRARYNPQRHYEIYSISTEDDMSEDDWHALWTQSPQEMANLIRERGTKIYSDRLPKRTQVIV